MSEEEKNELAAKKEAGKPAKGKHVLAYATLDGNEVRATEAQAGSLEMAELFPELPRTEPEDLYEGAFYVCDARMLGQGSKKGAYYVAMIAVGDAETGFEYTSTILGGKAVTRTVREIMGHDAEGEPAAGKTAKVPTKVKMVEIQGEDFAYRRLVSPDWTPDEGTTVLQGID